MGVETEGADNKAATWWRTSGVSEVVRAFAAEHFRADEYRQDAGEAENPHEGAHAVDRALASQFHRPRLHRVVDGQVPVQRHDGQEEDRRVIAHEPVPGQDK